MPRHREPFLPVQVLRDTEAETLLNGALSPPAGQDAPFALLPLPLLSPLPAPLFTSHPPHPALSPHPSGASEEAETKVDRRAPGHTWRHSGGRGRYLVARAEEVLGWAQRLQRGGRPGLNWCVSNLHSKDSKRQS